MAAGTGLAIPSWALSVTVVVVLLLSVLVVRRIDRPAGRWGRQLRSRLVMGVPWGTLVSVGLVLAVYLFVQGGWDHWYRPITIPFHSWSYFYPTGWLLAGFAHSGPGHLIGNLAGTVVLAPIIEYAWGHFPTERGTTAFGSWRTNPWVRALVLFPAAVVGVGLLTALFGVGPVIGFSGVVFAFAGAGLARYPLATVLGLLVQRAVSTVYRALQNPVVVDQATPSPPSPPWWSQIAIQGHALGLLIGLVIGVYVLRRRGDRPAALRVWTGVLLFGVAQSLWAVYWFRGNETYVLYRGLGVVLVALLALLVAVAATASDRPLVPVARRDVREWLDRVVRDRIDRHVRARFDGGAAGNDDGDRTPLVGVSRRQVAVAALLVATAAMAGPAIPTKLVTVDDGSVPGDPDDAIRAGGYSVTYAENVENRMVSVVDVSAFGETTAIRTSGVIVVNQRRHLWVQALSKGRLAFSGDGTVRVGGATWRERIDARRRGWSAAEGPTAYHVWLRPEGGDWRHVYNSSPARVGHRLDGKNVSVVPADGSFALEVTRENATLGRVAIPESGENATAAGLTFVRENRSVFAEYNRTRIRVAKREEYENG